MDLRHLIVSKIESLGAKKASEYFGVSLGTISNWVNGKTSPTIDAAQLVLSESTESGQASDSVPTDIEGEPLVNWEGREVMLLLPVYRSFNPKTHFTLFANYAKYGPDKLAIEFKERTVIHEARNILIDKGMSREGVKRFVMVDDDMVLPFGNPAVLNTKYRAKLPDMMARNIALSRLLSHGSDKGIVGVLYFGRSDAGTAQCASAFASKAEDAKFHNLSYNGLKKEDWVGAGVLKIERWVIEEMKKAVDGGKWPECKRDESSWYGYFNPLRVRTGEDVSFCRRAAEIGIQTYLDTSLVCGHADGNHIYWHWNTKEKTG